jgi:hypothetical protein
VGDVARHDPNAHRWRIEALRRFPGETTEEVLARRFDLSRRFDVHHRRARHALGRADEHRWMDRVTALARGVRPDFLVVVDGAGDNGHERRVRLLDERASVSIEVHADAVRVIPLPGYDGDPAAGFALMWELCQAFARDADCLIVDPTGIAVIEMELDVARAREEYGWI